MVERARTGRPACGFPPPPPALRRAVPLSRSAGKEVRSGARSGFALGEDLTRKATLPREPVGHPRLNARGWGAPGAWFEQFRSLAAAPGHPPGFSLRAARVAA